MEPPNWSTLLKINIYRTWKWWSLVQMIFLYNLGDFLFFVSRSCHLDVYILHLAPKVQAPRSWGSHAGQVGSWIMTLQKLEGVYGKQKIYEKQKMIFRKFENNISPTWGKWNGIKWWLSDSSFHWISWKDIIPNLLRFLRDDIDSALPKLEFAKAPNSKLNEPSLPSRI